MSAICGIFCHDGIPVELQVGAVMLSGFSQYSADYQEYWHEGKVFFGFHAQNITPESINERLPYYDAQARLTITADAIIDNRQELWDRLGIGPGDRAAMSDSMIILAAYKKWGRNCPRYLIGDFAFAIWDGQRRELFCAVDAMGTRTFYYSNKAGRFAFSTLMKPLMNVSGVAGKWNEVWLADFLAVPTVMHQLDPELTLYEDIFILPAGHTLTVGMTGTTKEVYWQLVRQAELRLASDADYVEKFLDVFGEAVRCRMRSIRPVGVMMSGGLDSTSIACLAARELAKTGGRLPAFSAVPMKGYQNWLPPTLAADETPYIEAVRRQAGNIDVVYCRSEGRHSLSDTDRHFAVLEQPYKFFENFFWLDGILAEARERNIGVLLTGQGGNATISWGDIDCYARFLLKTGKWRLLLREATAYATRWQRPVTRVLAGLVLHNMPIGVQKVVSRLREAEKYDATELSPISPEFACRRLMSERFRRFAFNPSLMAVGDSFSLRTQLINPAICSHGAQFLVKQSLAYGLAQRDPTTDRRVVEFCLSLPEGQYVRDGEERRFIRHAMVGILPDEVRLNDSVRGRQSADWLQRLLPHWPELIGEINRIGEQAGEGRYLDIERIRKGIEKFGNPVGSAANENAVRMLIRAVIFSRFCGYENKNNSERRCN